MDILKTKGVDLTTPAQKAFALVLLIGVLVLLYWALPPLVLILQNLWLALILGVPLLFVVGYAIYNPFMIWGIFKTLSWNLTKWIVSKDILGTMERYYDHLVIKHTKLNETLNKIVGVKKTLERQMSEIGAKINEDELILKNPHANISESQLTIIANKVAVNRGIMNGVMPRYETIETQVNYLQQLSDIWGADIRKLRDTLDAKIQEYEMYKNLDGALGSAKEFINGDNEQGKVFNESLKQLEQNVTQYMANIENFEKNAKPFIEEGKIKQSLLEEQGRAIIEEFKAKRIT